jgi:hypothetical protein
MPETLYPNLNGVAETLLLPLLGSNCHQITLSDGEEAASFIAEAFIYEAHPSF